MMTGLAMAAVALAVACGAASADPLADGHFVTGVTICLGFGADDWFAQDRSEGAGFARRCRVISGAVTRSFAERAVEAVPDAGGNAYDRGTVDGCRACKNSLDQVIGALNDGHENLCDSEDSARVSAISYTDLTAGQ